MGRVLHVGAGVGKEIFRTLGIWARKLTTRDQWRWIKLLQLSLCKRFKTVETLNPAQNKHTRLSNNRERAFPRLLPILALSRLFPLLSFSKKKKHWPPWKGWELGLKEKKWERFRSPFIPPATWLAHLIKGGRRGLIYERQTSEPEVELGLESRPDQH